VAVKSTLLPENVGGISSCRKKGWQKTVRNYRFSFILFFEFSFPYLLAHENVIPVLFAATINAPAKGTAPENLGLRLCAKAL